MDQLHNRDEDRLQACMTGLSKARSDMEKVIVGQKEALSFTLMALLCEGHVLFEGVPGLGKTLLVRTLGSCLNLRFSRIQFTPDLMPADVIGTSMIARESDGDLGLTFEQGPVFTNLLLADEINRASPKTQSALLEAMQERTVTVRGQQHVLPRPFLVLATQNPLDMEGTYPLPEAQTDRFLFKIIVDHPAHNELMEIIHRTVGPAQAAQPLEDAARLSPSDLVELQQAVKEVVLPSHLADFASRMVLATHPQREASLHIVRKYLRFGSGPRGAQALAMAAKAHALVDGRFSVGMEDIQAVMLPALRHRISLSFDGQSEGIVVDTLLSEIAEGVLASMKLPAALR